MAGTRQSVRLPSLMADVLAFAVSMCIAFIPSFRLHFQSERRKDRADPFFSLAGCVAVFHIAAVVQMSARDPEAEIVRPSVEGAKYVLSILSPMLFPMTLSKA